MAGIFFLKTWIHIFEYWSHPNSYLGYWHIFHEFVFWLLAHFSCDNIDINDSNPDGENISYATCRTDEFETINKPKLSCRLHRWCPSSRFHRWCHLCRLHRRCPLYSLHRWCKSFFLVGGLWIKALSKSNVKQRFMNVDKNGSIAKAFLQNMAFVFKWQGEDDNKEDWTIFKKYHPNKSHNMTRLGFIIFEPVHDLNDLTLLCSDESMCPKTRLELCCHHSGWDIVLQAHATQMSKCCDLLESGMSTSLKSNGFCLISSDNVKYVRWATTYLIKFIKLHKKSRQSLKRQVQLPDSRIGKTNITCCAPVGV